MKKKKWLAIVLSMIMALTMAPMVTFAAEVGDNVEYNGVKYKIINENDVEVTTGNSFSGEVTIPSEIMVEGIQYTVTGVGTGAFRETRASENKVTSVILPETIEYIGNSAFQECYSLKSVTFDGNSRLESIGRLAFIHATELSEFHIPETVTSIGVAAFGNCQSLKSIVIPSGVTQGLKDVLAGIDYSGDYYIPYQNGAYPNARNVTISSDNTEYYIYNGGLYKGDVLELQLDDTLQTVNVKDGTTTISSGAFHDLGYGSTASWETIILPDTVTVIEDAAFRNSPMKNITMSENLSEIGASAFAYCENLESIYIPKGVTEILGSTNMSYGATFQGCVSLKNVIFEEGNIKSIADSAFRGCSSLMKFDFSGVDSIGANAFEGCESLRSIDIPEGVTEIPDYAFAGCVSLEKITLPEGLNSIGEYAFDLTADDGNGNYVNDDPKLESVNIPSTVTSLGNMFLGGLKPDGGTALISQTADPSIYTETAISGITGDGVNKPTMYYPDEYKDAYTGNTILMNSGLLPANESQTSSQGYALSVKDTMTVCPGKTAAESVLNSETTVVPGGESVSYTSSNNAVATVDENGVITGVANGEAVVTSSIVANGVTLVSGDTTVTVGHNFVNGVCTLCGDPDSDYEEPTNPQQPSDEGTTTGGSQGSENQSGTSDDSDVKTGDDSSIALWAALLALAASGAAGTVIYGRKRREQ